MVCRNEQNISIILAGLVDLADRLICGGNTLGSCLVDTGVADHVRRSEVVHNEFEFLLAKTFNDLVTNSPSAHLRVEVVCGNPGRGDQIPLLTWELLLDTTVEEESDVGIFLCLCNVALLDILLAKPLREDVAHVLGWERNGEGIVGFILCHGSEMDVLGVGEVGLRGAIEVTQQLGDLPNTVGTVVEEEEGIII